MRDVAAFLVLLSVVMSGCARAGKGAPAAPERGSSFPVPSRVEGAPQTESGPVTLAVVGDLMLARGVDYYIFSEHRGDVTYPFAAVAERLRAADYTFANLESPLGLRGRPIPGKGIWFRARPETIEGIRFAGVDGVTVANNHILDYDEENFRETLSLLRENGIGVTGGGEDLAAARAPLVADVKGVKVAFLGYSDFADLHWDASYKRSFAATASRPGVAPVREETLAEDIARAREAADVVAVAFHWGDEYMNHPNEKQVRLARRAIDLGADLVLGYHPHAIQGIERYKDGLIAYSLGNFVMDNQRRAVAEESMILEVRLTRGGLLDHRVLPVRIRRGQPRILEGEAAKALMDKIERISAGLGG